MYITSARTYISDTPDASRRSEVPADNTVYLSPT